MGETKCGEAPHSNASTRNQMALKRRKRLLRKGRAAVTDYLKEIENGLAENTASTYTEIVQCNKQGSPEADKPGKYRKKCSKRQFCIASKPS